MEENVVGLVKGVADSGIVGLVEGDLLGLCDGKVNNDI